MSETLIHADIFFFVTTIIVILIGLGIIVALYYIIRILRAIDFISKEVKGETVEIIEDVRTFRTSMKEDGIRLKPFLALFKSLFKRTQGKKTSNKHKHHA
jgi:hypothetical protein